MRITVFDFDDTLFCSTHFRKVVEDVKSKIPISDLILGTELPKELVFEKLAVSILELLSVAMKNSDKVMIITNASRNWVTGVFEEHLPGCNIIPGIIDVVSCLDDFSKDTETEMWKVKAFDAKLGTFFSQEGRHELISIGDSLLDRSATLSIEEKYSNVVVKHLKLCDFPSLEDVLLQHMALRLYLPILAEKPTRVDECLVKISEKRYFISPFVPIIPSMFGAPVVLGQAQEVSC